MRWACLPPLGALTRVGRWSIDHLHWGIALAAAALFLGFLVGPRTYRSPCGYSEDDEVQLLAISAAAWGAAHDGDCPTLEDLGRVRRAVLLACDATAEAIVVVVVSDGDDDKFGTGDDPVAVRRVPTAAAAAPAGPR